MCDPGSLVMPDDIAMEDDPDYYKHNKHIKQCARSHSNRNTKSALRSPLPAVDRRSNHDVEDIYHHWDTLVAMEDLPALSEIITDLVADPPRTERGLEQALIRERKKRKCTFRKAQLLYTYSKLVGEGTLEPCAKLASLLVKKSSKSQSGVLVITVLTSPYP